MKKLIMLAVLAQPAFAENWICTENVGVRFCGDTDTYVKTAKGFEFSYKKQVNQKPWEYGTVQTDCEANIRKETFGNWTPLTRPLDPNYQYNLDTVLCPIQIQWKRDSGQ